MSVLGAFVSAAGCDTSDTSETAPQASPAQQKCLSWCQARKDQSSPQCSSIRPRDCDAYCESNARMGATSDKCEKGLEDEFGCLNGDVCLQTSVCYEKGVDVYKELCQTDQFCKDHPDEYLCHV